MSRAPFTLIASEATQSSGAVSSFILDCRAAARLAMTIGEIANA
ncbi:MAG: hypothetical protein ACKOAN_05400 [Chakrabartia sp.]